MTPTQHVILALALTGVLFVIAGERWSARVAMLQPVSPARKSV